MTHLHVSDDGAPPPWPSTHTHLSDCVQTFMGSPYMNPLSYHLPHLRPPLLFPQFTLKSKKKSWAFPVLWIISFLLSFDVGIIPKWGFPNCYHLIGSYVIHQVPFPSSNEHLLMTYFLVCGGGSL